MALTNNQITAQNFKDFYEAIRPYLGGAHGGFTPIGTVIAVMGNSAPANYLACDGTVYNIADYPELARYFYQQFEAINFFGGDGTTTFAVPDLRGEFLRGTGANSHTNQGGGANVGTHQDGTLIASAWGDDATIFVAGENSASTSLDLKRDSLQPNSFGRFVNSTAYSGSELRSQIYTSRPTNTSVLYCIAVKNIFMDAGSNYSTDEQVVGTWIDGKPLYQKTIEYPNVSSVSASSWTTIDSNFVSDVDKIIKAHAIAIARATTVAYDNILGVAVTGTTAQIRSMTGQSIANVSPIVTYQYTKTS